MHVKFFLDVDFIEIKKNKKIVDIFDIKIKNIFIFINSKLLACPIVYM